MKNLFLLIVLVLSALVLKAAGADASYVTVGSETYFCQSVKPGLFNMNLLYENGTTLRVPLKNVNAYTCKGRLFERLPVICHGKPSHCTTFMELMNVRNGLKLYKCSEYGECGSLCDNSFRKEHLQTEYYVFKDGEFFLTVTRSNAGSVLPFFGIEAL